MFEYLLTSICHINRSYQHNKKDLYDLFLLGPIDIIRDVCNIMNALQL